MFHSAGNSVARLYACLFAALSLFSLAGITHGQTIIIDWIEANGGSYNDISNWNPSNVPNTTSESARFNVPRPFNVTLNSGSTTTVSDLLIDDGDVTFAAAAAVFATYITDDDVIISSGDLTLSQAGGNGDIRLTVGDDLTINSGGSLTVEQGSLVTTGDLGLGNSGFGMTSSMTFDASNFTRTNTTAFTMGDNGATAILTLRNGAQGDIDGTLSLAGSSSDFTAAFVNVEDDADLELDSLNIGTIGSSTVANGNVTVTGSGSTITQTGASTLTIGTVAGNIGILDVNTSGVFNSGTGAIDVRATGKIDVQSGGVFAANGNVTITQGEILNDGGAVDFGGDLTIDGGVYEEDQASTADRTFAPNTTTTITNGGRMTLNSEGFFVDAGRTLVLDGAGSELNLEGVFTNVTIGGLGGGTDGTMTLRNNASLTPRDMSMRANGADQTATLNVLSGADLSFDSSSGLGRFSILASETNNGQAIINVDGSGSNIFVNDVFSPLTLGHQSGTGTTATMNLTNGGQFSSDDEGLVINPLGTVHFEDGGLFMLGDLVVRGGTVERAAGSNGFVELNSFAEIEMRVVEGGSVDLNQFAFGLITNRLTVDGPGSSFTLDGDTVESGNVWIGSELGFADGALVVSNLAVASTRTLSLAKGGFASGGMARAEVLSGGTLTTDHLGIGRFIQDFGSELSADNFPHSAEMNIDGPGSIVTIRSGYQVHVGSEREDAVTAGQFGTLNLTDGGELDASAATLYINRAGIVNLAGGILRAGTVNFDFHGQFNFNSGTLSLTGDLLVENAQLLGPTVELTAGKHLVLAGNLDIRPNRAARLDGGSLEVQQIIGLGTFEFLSGSLTVNGTNGFVIGPAGPLAGSSLLLDSGKQLHVANTTFVQGGTTVVVQNGGVLEAATIDNSGEIVLEGTLAELNGGLTNRGFLRGNGRVNALLDNQDGAEVRVTAGNRLVFDGGAPHANAGKLTLVGGEADFQDSLVNNATGDITGRGTLRTARLINHGDLALSGGVTDVHGGVDNRPTGRVIVSGKADVTFWDDVEHTGTLFNVASGSSATFFGTAGFGISGGGDVFFEADITPGASPGLETFGGNVHFGELASLEIEIGGTTKGSQYDALDIAGTATLDGLLGVSLLGDFEPGAGDAFDILTAAGGITGTFATELLPALAGDLFWDVNYTADSVSLAVVAPGLPGDYNQDGAVDAADYIVWRKNDGTSEGYNTWRANFGQPSGSGSGASANAAVPEPATLVLLMFAAAGWSLWRGRAH